MKAWLPALSLPRLLPLLGFKQDHTISALSINLEWNPFSREKTLTSSCHWGETLQIKRPFEAGLLDGFCGVPEAPFPQIQYQFFAEVVPDIKIPHSLPPREKEEPVGPHPKRQKTKESPFMSMDEYLSLRGVEPGTPPPPPLSL